MTRRKQTAQTKAVTVREAYDLKDDDDGTLCQSCGAAAVDDGPYCRQCKDYWENDAPLIFSNYLEWGAE